MKQLFIIGLLISLIGCVKNQKEKKEEITQNIEKVQVENDNNRILFVVSNQHTYGDTNINAANHFAEIVLAYDVFKNSGYKIDFVSPKGGAIPIGYLNTSDTIEKQYLYDFEFMDLLKNTLSPDLIQSERYQAVYYGGGGAAMFGVPDNEAIQQITMDIYEKNNGVVSAICHGTAGLVNLKTENGTFIYEGKKVNGFPDVFENMDAEYYKQFPFSIEQIIKERGGNFSYSPEGWDNYYVVDGRLITGQDPTAAASVAQQVIKVLSPQ
nr:type 1 glutamine amidotransferase domain-containing protein [Allomuricauda sp.]